MKLKFRQIAVLTVYVILNLFIFAEALTPGEESSKHSSSITSIISDAIAKLGSDKFEFIEPTSINIEDGAHELYIGESLSLKATLLPENATNKVIQWKSSDTSIASVTSTGGVRANKEGQVNIIAYADASDTVYKEYALNIKRKTVEQVYPTSISFTTVPTNKTMLNEATFRLGGISFAPSNCNNRGVTYSSSNESVARIVGGVLYSYAPGVTTIKVTSTYNKSLSDSFELTVKDQTARKPESYTIDADDEVYVGRTAKFNILIPEGTYDDLSKVVTVTSDNGGGASFSEGKGLTGSKAGIVNVKVCDLYSKSVCSSKNVTVKNVDPESLDIILSGDIEHFASGKSIKLESQILPNDTTLKDVTWTISDEQKAYLASDGTLIGLKHGDIDITLTHNDTGMSVTKTVKILKASALSVAEEQQLHAKIRKAVGHFGLFMVDGLIGFLFYITLKNLWLRYSLMFGSGLVFATTAELLQLIPEGRYCCFSDMVINNSGYLAGTLIGLLFYLIIWLIKRAFKKKKGVQDNG